MFSNPPLTRAARWPLRYRCVYKDTNELVYPGDDDQAFCSNNYEHHRCPEGQRCVDNIDGNIFKNPWYGFIGFDNLLQSMNTVLVIASLEGHDEIMYKLINATKGAYAIPYVFVIVGLVSYFSLNLILAVIYDSYTAVVVQEKTKAKALEEAQKPIAENEATFTGKSMSKDIADSPSQEIRPRLLTMTNTLPDIESDPGVPDQALTAVEDTASAILEQEIAEDNKQQAIEDEEDRLLSWRETKKSRELYLEKEKRRALRAATSQTTPDVGSKTVNAEGLEMTALKLKEVSLDDDDLSSEEGGGDLTDSSSRKINAANDVYPSSEEDDDANGAPLPCWKDPIACIRDKCYRIAISGPWFYLMYTCIMLNFVLLACEFHGMPDWYAKIIRIANEVLITFFMAEIGVNALGLGLKYYTHDSFNFCDAIIVVGSFIEAFFLKQNGNFNLTTLRSLRLLRVLRGLKVLKH